MNTYTNKHNMPYAPTDTADLYPDTDGQPMAASDLHLEILIRLLQALRVYFSEIPEVYVSGDILTYYIEGDPRAVCAPGCTDHFRHRSEATPHLQSMGRRKSTRLRDGVLK